MSYETVFAVVHMRILVSWALLASVSI